MCFLSIFTRCERPTAVAESFLRQLPLKKNDAHTTHCKHLRGEFLPNISCIYRQSVNLSSVTDLHFEVAHFLIFKYQHQGCRVVVEAGSSRSESAFLSGDGVGVDSLRSGSGSESESLKMFRLHSPGMWSRSQTGVKPESVGVGSFVRSRSRSRFV